MSNELRVSLLLLLRTCVLDFVQLTFLDTKGSWRGKSASSNVGIDWCVDQWASPASGPPGRKHCCVTEVQGAAGSSPPDGNQINKFWL